MVFSLFFIFIVSSWKKYSINMSFSHMFQKWEMGASGIKPPYHFSFFFSFLLFLSHFKIENIVGPHYGKAVEASTCKVSLPYWRGCGSSPGCSTLSSFLLTHIARCIRWLSAWGCVCIWESRQNFLAPGFHFGPA